ncbi:MAG: thioredoxin-disulfide reductase [Eubacteriales bacterium]
MKEYDVIIVGAGPAGLAAAIYAKRARLHTLLIEKTGMSGGQIINTYEVDNYPGVPEINGFELGMKMREHADRLGITFQTGTLKKLVCTEKRKQVITEEETYHAKTVILAMGATYAKLGVAGEETCLGKGVSYCATCDGAFFRDKIVAVVGGGDVAVEDAIFLSRFATKVYVIHRRDQLRAAAILQEQLWKASNIEMVWNAKVTEIIGKEVVTGVEIVNLEGEKRRVEIDGIFIAIGLHPNSEAIVDVVAVDESGYIVADETGATNQSGVYGCGDIRTKQLRQVVTAVSDGANAITSIQQFLIEEN